jgi:ribose transport system substrate-binding protein
MKKFLRICLFFSVFLFAVLAFFSILELSNIERSVNPAKPRTDRMQIVFHFAVLIPSPSKDLFFMEAFNRMNKAAEEERAVLQLFEYEPGKDNNSIKSLLELIHNIHPDGVIVSIPNDASYEDALNQLKEKNIPIVNLEYNVSSSYRDAFIGTNEFDAGRLSALTAAHLLPNGGEVGVLLSESPERNTAQNTSYLQGFQQAIRDFPSIQVNLISSYDNTAVAGEEFVREILIDHPGISLAVFTNDDEALGAAQALIEYGRVGTPLIISVDDTPEIRRFMEMGVISASIIRNPERAGQSALESLVSLARNERTNAYINTGSSVLYPDELKGLQPE